MRPGLRIAWVAAACLGLLGCGGEQTPPAQTGPRYDGDGFPRHAPVSEAARPNLIVFCAHGLGADDLAAMPWLRARAAGGVTFSRAFASTDWPASSLASLATGKRPSGHGVVDEERAPRLPPGVVTYAEIMRNAFQFEVVGHAPPSWGGRAGILQGCTLLPGDAPEAALTRWAAARDAKRPFCLVVVDDPAPARAPADADRALRASYEAAERAGLLERTMCVFTSTYGRATAARGLHAARTHVPLVVWGPAPFSARTVERVVGVLDVVPTFFDWAEMLPPADRDGVSFLPLLSGGSRARPLAGETTVVQEDRHTIWKSLRSDELTFFVQYDVIQGRVIERLMRADDLDRDLAVDGVVAPDLVSGAFCTGVETLRDQIWDEVASVAARADTIYGGGITPVKARRPAGCASDE